MIQPVLTKEGQEVLDNILNMRLPILREGRKKKYYRNLSLLMNEQGCKEAGKELVIEAARMVESAAFVTFFLSRENPDKLEEMLLPHWDMEAYYAQPIGVKRWEHPPVSKPAKRPEEMKVLAFCASPRTGGNTDVLIDEALRGAADAGAKIEKIMLQKIKLGFCISCRKCKEPDFDRICALKDDMADIYPKILDSDALIIGFPNYMGRECGQLATFLDRWDCFTRFKFSKMLEPGRRALVIHTYGATDLDCFDHVVENIMNMLYGNQVETVEAISAGGFSGILRGFDENGKAMVLRFPKELEKAYQAGKSLVTGEG